MVSCAACGYSKTPKNKNSGVTFHSFPKDEKRRLEWVRFVNKAEFVPNNRSLLCSQHFKKECFDRSSETVVRLFPTAFPTIQIERIKYMRTFSQEIQKPSTSSGKRFSPPTAGLCSVEEEESPRRRNLKRKIKTLENVNIFKSSKIRRLQKINWRQKKRISSLKAMVGELKNKNLLLDEHSNVIMDHFGDNKEFMQRLLRKAQHKSVKKSYEQSVRAFAVTLHFFSPKAYSYVRQKFENSLPHPKTLSKWYSSVEAKPGFTTEAFNFLKLKMENTEKEKIICSLVFDEISIRKHLEYTGGEYHGYVAFGSGIQGDSMDLATEALVFMIVCINEAWKLPIGYFFTAGINSQQKTSLLKQALTLLVEVGVTVSNITFDGCVANFSMCSLLGCPFEAANIKAEFSFNNKKYFLYPDPVHMLKLIRNCFGEKKKFIDMNGDIVNFEFVEKLNHLQNTEGLHLGTKIRDQHIRFFRQKMKVKLATQLLSSSVSEALHFCKDKLHLEEFQNCRATAEFILLINNAFDILNSHKISDFGFKQATCEKNINNIKLFYNHVCQYVMNFKLLDGTPILRSKRKTGFIGILIGLKALLGLYEEYIYKGSLKFIPTYKLNQDHIELFFGTIRSQGGHNNNPSCRQFTAAYKKILIHAEVREGGAGNCVPLEEINILNVSSKNKPPEQIINESLGNQPEDNESEDDTAISDFLNDHSYAFTCDALSPYVQAVIVYIAGFVSFKLGRKLKCEQCVAQLFGVKEDFLNSLISTKSKGALSYPSDGVILICQTAEKFLRSRTYSDEKINEEEVSLKVMKHFIGKIVFHNMTCHDFSPLENHETLLIKSILRCYLKTRICYICKNTVKEDRIRNLYSKMILFKNQ